MIGQIDAYGSLFVRYYYLKDHLRSVRLTVDSVGTPTEWDDYYAFGSIMPNRSQDYANGEKYKFTAKERDAETGWDYFGARYYDSKIGRWLQVDPLAVEYPGWNPYNYTFNNPINLKDLFGKKAVPADPAQPPFWLLGWQDQWNQWNETGGRFPIYNSAVSNDGPLQYKGTEVFNNQTSTKARGASTGLILIYSHDANRIFLVNGEGKLLATFEARDEFFPGKNKDGLDRISLPNGDYSNITIYEPGVHYGEGYGTFYIDTGDLRGHDIHGGGSNKSIIPDPYVPRQGWLATYGCIRMQNEDGEFLSRYILNNGGVDYLHVQGRSYSGLPAKAAN